MQQYIARSSLLSAVIGGLSEAPVVALLGARQVGKTTLAGQVASAWAGPCTVFDLEVAATREALSMTPEKLLRESEGLVILDEVQRMPALFEILRPICDSQSRKAVIAMTAFRHTGLTWSTCKYRPDQQGTPAIRPPSTTMQWPWT